MFFYIAIFLLFLFSSLLEIISNNRKFSLNIFFILILSLYILSFIRWETGTDWTSYYEMYTWIKIPWKEMIGSGMEFGFVFVNHLGKCLFDSYTGVLFLFSTIIYFCLSRSYVELIKYPITALFLTFCISTFAHMLYVRQNIATAILCLSIIYVRDRKFLQFLVLVFLASLFHRTAWIFLLAYPLYDKHFSFKFYTTSLVLSIVLGVTAGGTLISLLGNIPIEAVSRRITGYLELGEADNSTTFSTTTMIIKGFANRGIILVLLFFCRYKLNYKDNFFIGLINIYIYGTIVYFFTLPLSISLARAAVYMDTVQVLLIPYIIYKQKKLYNRLLLLGIISIYFGLRFYTSLQTYWDAYVPFETFLEK